jgi:hypothetical protein
MDKEGQRRGEKKKERSPQRGKEALVGRSRFYKDSSLFGTSRV